MAVMKPVPCRPSRFSFGTRQSSKISSRVAERADAHLVFLLPEREAGRPLLDDEGRGAARALGRVGHAKTV